MARPKKEQTDNLTIKEQTEVLLENIGEEMKKKPQDAVKYFGAQADIRRALMKL